MKHTAVNWIYDQIENNAKCIYEVIEQAKAMEKEQKIKFAFDFYYDFSNQLGVPFNLISENRTNAEKYYEQKFKSESFCNCPKGKGIDFDENQKAYCIDCGKNINL